MHARFEHPLHQADEYYKVVRDVRERGRDIEGCVKQWFAFVKPNFEKASSGTCLLIT